MAKTMKKKGVSHQVSKLPPKERRKSKTNEDPTTLANKPDAQDLGAVVLPKAPLLPQAPMCSIGCGLSLTAEGVPIPP